MFVDSFIKQVPYHLIALFWSEFESVDSNCRNAVEYDEDLLQDVLDSAHNKYIAAIKDTILKNIKYTTSNKAMVGGQSCGLSPTYVIATSEELDLKIELGYSRSNLTNFKVVEKMINLALNEFIKN